MRKVMIVAPHPDDAELAMGGVIAKMIDGGWEVTIVDLTDGEPTPFGSKELRKKETERANQALGIKRRICLDMPNRYLQATLENRRRLAEVIRLNRPDVLFGPAKPDYHPDHIATADLTAGARFEAKLQKTDMQGTAHWVRRQHCYYSIHRLCHDKPSFVVDVTNNWDKKVASIKAYESQLKNLSSKGSVSLLERVDAVGRYFGQCIGAKYGEPFVGSEPLCVSALGLLGDLS